MQRQQGTRVALRYRACASMAEART